MASAESTQRNGLLRFIQPKLRQCPVPIILQAIQDIAVEYFTQTEAWELTITTTSVDDDATYDVQELVDDATDCNALLWRITGVNYKADLDANAYEIDEDGILTLDVAPTETGTTITINAVVVPQQDWNHIDDGVWLRHNRGIREGTLFHLFAQNAVWGDGQMAEFHEDAYNDLKANARGDRLQARKQGLLRVAPRLWY